MRKTLAKAISDRNFALAQLLADELWKHRDTDGLGNGYMAKVLGFEWRTVRDKENSTHKVYGLMETVQRIVAAEHPGYMVERRGDGLARITNDPDAATRQFIPRLHKVMTHLTRADSECDVIRRNSTDPVQHELAAGVRASLSNLRTQVESASAKEVERIADQQAG